ncbi:uncharacterized mitochondrial protein-like protein [Tanacetum coccineum]
MINHGQAKPIKCYNCNGLGHIARECTRPKRLQDSDYFKDKMLLMQAQESGAVLDEEQSFFLVREQVTNVDDDVDDSPENDLALNVDHIFEADECDAFDSDVDEGPTSQTMFMANLTSEDPIYDEAGTSYDSNNPFKVSIREDVADDLALNIDHVFQADQYDAFDSDVDEAPTAQTMFMVNLSSADPIYDEAGPSYDSNILSEVHDHDNYLVNVDAEYTSDSNIILYKQYVKNNADAMQVQSALYNGHEIIKTNHAPAIVHDSEDTLELAEITRKNSKTTVWNEFSNKGSANPTDPYHTPTFIQPSPQPQKTQKPRKPKRKNTHVPQPSDHTESVVDEAVHKELGDSLVKAATTTSSLEAEHDSGNITKTQSNATPNEFSSLGTTSGGGPRCQETMGDTIAQTRFENVSKHSNDSLLVGGKTLRSDEDRFKLDELMALCTTLKNRVLDLEKTKTTQANEIASLKRMVKKLEKKNMSRTHKLKRLYKVGLTDRVESSGDEESLGEDVSKQGRINVIDADDEITLVSVQDDADKEMFDVDALNVSTAVTTVTITTIEITLAQALKALKTLKPKVKGIVFQEPGKSTTTKTTISSQQSQDKGKGILIELVEPMKKKYLIRLDEEVALKLQVEFDEEERLTREKAEKERKANIALIETWDDIHAKIDADHQLAESLQAQEQEELSVEEKATLF